ncbi:MAG: DNA repair protein [Planctomycetota bacterium]
MDRLNSASSIDSENRVADALDDQPSVDSGEKRLRRLRQLADQLVWKKAQVTADLKATEKALEATRQYLDVSQQVTEALDHLSQKLFEEVLNLLRDKLSIAIQEVLEQPVNFHAEASFKRGSANVDFSVERDGNTEDVNRGQGGSVQNVLSVGLRLFALARLDGEVHRRFLVLDEQDCWLRPELVPRLVKIVYRAAQELGFQVIMISHHDVKLFERYADKIYHFEPEGSGVKVSEIKQ